MPMGSYVMQLLQCATTSATPCSVQLMLYIILHLLNIVDTFRIISGKLYVQRLLPFKEGTWRFARSPFSCTVWVKSARLPTTRL
jgi:hypothetical protein